MKLAVGQCICAARDPVYFSEGLACSPRDEGSRWEAHGPGVLSFAAGDAVSATKLDISKPAYVVAAGLVALWTGEVWFEPFELPGITGFTRVSGQGQIWLLIPGWEIRVPHHPSAIAVDPARLAWAKADAEPLAAVAGPGSQPWMRLSGPCGQRLPAQRGWARLRARAPR